MTTEQRANAVIALVEHLANTHTQLVVAELSQRKTVPEYEQCVELIRNIALAAGMSAALSVCDRFRRVKGVNADEEWEAFNLASERLGFGHTRVGAVTNKGEVIPEDPFHEN